MEKRQPKPAQPKIKTVEQRQDARVKQLRKEARNADKAYNKYNR